MDEREYLVIRPCLAYCWTSNTNRDQILHRDLVLMTKSEIQQEASSILDTQLRKELELGTGGCEAGHKETKPYPPSSVEASGEVELHDELLHSIVQKLWSSVCTEFMIVPAALPINEWLASKEISHAQVSPDPVICMMCPSRTSTIDKVFNFVPEITLNIGRTIRCFLGDTDRSDTEKHYDVSVTVGCQDPPDKETEPCPSGSAEASGESDCLIGPIVMTKDVVLTDKSGCSEELCIEDLAPVEKGDVTSMDKSIGEIVGETTKIINQHLKTPIAKPGPQNETDPDEEIDPDSTSSKEEEKRASTKSGWPLEGTDQFEQQEDGDYDKYDNDDELEDLLTHEEIKPSSDSKYFDHRYPEDDQRFDTKPPTEPPEK